MKNILSVIKTILLTGVVTLLTIIPVMADSNDSNILNHYTDSKGDMITQYKDGTTYTNSDVKIQSIDYIQNTVTINKDGKLYSFYTDNRDNYYLDETINVTFNNKMEIVDCAVLSQPQIYNTQIESIQGNTAFVIANGNKYTFDNTEGLDGWKTGEKCKAVIQDDKLLEVQPIPIVER